MSKYALITVIESDLLNIDQKNYGYERYFEQEAIKCFTHWRVNGGWLDNIPIYVVCPSKYIISHKTKEQFKLLNVKYIEKFFPETEHYKCGFWNKPLGCQYLENILKGVHEKLIHIDLDMYLLKPLSLVDLQANQCLVYDQYQKKKERGFKNNLDKSPFNTCFMVVNTCDQVFQQWYLELKQLPEFSNSYYKQYINLEYKKLEELAFDLLSLKVEIRAIKNLIFGETYTEIENLGKEEVESIRFHHYHIYNSYKTYKWLKNLKKYQYALQSRSS